MNKQELIQELKTTISRFQELISSFDEEQLNLVPFENSWTAGQVAQHIILANSGFADVLNGPVKNTDGAADQQLDQIRTIFLDFDTKLQSPDFVLPVLKDYHKDKQLAALEKIKLEVSKAVDELDLNQTCLAFELPVLGHLTRLEAVYFLIYHTQRHAYQLNNIREKILN